MRSRHPNPVGKVKSRVGLASRDYPQGEKRRVNNTNVCAYGKTCSNRSGTDIYRDGGLVFTPLYFTLFSRKILI